MTESDFERSSRETIARIEVLLRRVSYPDHRWKVGAMEHGAYLQIVYVELDVDDGKSKVQSGRKWVISPHATDSEIYQTALKAALTSAEHRVREHFLVDGLRVFGPHLDIDALLRFAREHTTKKRSAK